VGHRAAAGLAGDGHLLRTIQTRPDMAITAAEVDLRLAQAATLVEVMEERCALFIGQPQRQRFRPALQEHRIRPAEQLVERGVGRHHSTVTEAGQDAGNGQLLDESDESLVPASLTVTHAGKSACRGSRRYRRADSMAFSRYFS